MNPSASKNQKTKKKKKKKTSLVGTGGSRL
jgi:hypothetical protein